MYYSEADMTPPPVVIYDEDADDDAIKEALTRLLQYEFSLRRSKNAVYFYTHTKDDYDVLIKFLQFHKHGYQTYRPPWDDTQLIVLRDYPGNHCAEEEIIAKLKKRGVKCLGVHVINRRPEEFDYVARLLTLAGNTNLDYVREIRKLGNVGGISWEDYATDKYTPVQCSRCQRFHHDSRFCYMPPNCNTCAGEHWSQDCKRSSKKPEKCFNCKGNHAATDSWCSDWISYKDRLVNARARAEKKLARAESRAAVSYVEPVTQTYSNISNDQLQNVKSELDAIQAIFAKLELL